MFSPNPVIRLKSILVQVISNGLCLKVSYIYIYDKDTNCPFTCKLLCSNTGRYEFLNSLIKFRFNPPPTWVQSIIHSCSIWSKHFVSQQYHTPIEQYNHTLIKKIGQSLPVNWESPLILITIIF